MKQKPPPAAPPSMGWIVEGLGDTSTEASALLSSGVWPVAVSAVEEAPKKKTPARAQLDFGGSKKGGNGLQLGGMGGGGGLSLGSPAFGGSASPLGGGLSSKKGASPSPLGGGGKGGSRRAHI